MVSSSLIVANISFCVQVHISCSFLNDILFLCIQLKYSVPCFILDTRKLWFTMYKASFDKEKDKNRLNIMYFLSIYLTQYQVESLEPQVLQYQCCSKVSLAKHMYTCSGGFNSQYTKDHSTQVNVKISLNTRQTKLIFPL